MKEKISKCAILFSLLLLSSFLSAQNAGSLDKSYSNGSGGTVTTNMQNLNGRGQALTIRDGKILIAGTVFIGAESYFQVNRYNNDGTRDLTFGNGFGQISNGIRGLNKFECYGNAIAISPNDAGFFVAGSARAGAKYNDVDFSLAKIDYSGNLYNLWPNSSGIGITANSIGNNDDFGNACVVQQDGKIVVVGLTTNVNFGTTDFGIIRYNSDGSLDNTFSNDGIQITDISGNDAAYSVVIQSDNKILVSGKTTNNLALVRYNSDGSLDNTFGNGGMKIVDINSGPDCGFSLALQSNGKIVVAGKSNNGANDFMAVVRFNTDGTLDNSFSSDGIQTTIIGNLNTYGNSVVVQNDGKVIVAGGVNTGIRNNVAIVRYNSDGSLDNNFSEDGIQTTEVGEQAFGNALVIQLDGKLVVGGFAKIGSVEDFALIRYNTDGSLDNSFSFDGKVLTNNRNSADGAFASKLQADGKLIVVGVSIMQNISDFALIRYNTDGSLDKTFGNEGKQITDVLGFDDYAYSLTIQADGKSIVAGYSNNGNYNLISLARYNTDGSLDKTFSGDGIQTIDLGQGNNSLANSILVQTDGKILIGGSVNEDFALIRLNTDGTYDNTFSQDGIQIINLGSFDIARSLALQTDNKILLAGSAGGNFAILRFNIDGTLDNTFSDDGIQISDYKGMDDFGRSVAVQKDGNILLGGTSDKDIAIVRYTKDGNIDSTYGNDGFFISNIPGNDFGKAIAIQSDGKVVIAGGNANTDTFDFVLIRLNSEGTYDNLFGKNGVVKTAFFENGSEWANSLSIQSDGQIILVGTSIYGNIADFALARYSSVKGTVIKSATSIPQNIKLYPNPASNELIVDYPDLKTNTPFCIINSLGQIVFKGYLNEYKSKIDISYLPTGVYIIKIGETEKSNFKIIKE